MKSNVSYGLIVICLIIIAITAVVNFNSTNPIGNNAPLLDLSANSISNSNLDVKTVSNNIMVDKSTITFKKSKNVLKSHEMLKNNDLAQTIADLK